MKRVIPLIRPFFLRAADRLLYSKHEDKIEILLSNITLKDYDYEDLFYRLCHCILSDKDNIIGNEIQFAVSFFKEVGLFTRSSRISVIDDIEEFAKKNGLDISKKLDVILKNKARNQKLMDLIRLPISSDQLRDRILLLLMDVNIRQVSILLYNLGMTESIRILNLKMLDAMERRCLIKNKNEIDLSSSVDYKKIEKKFYEYAHKIKVQPSHLEVLWTYDWAK